MHLCEVIIFKFPKLTLWKCHRNMGCKWWGWLDEWFFACLCCCFVRWIRFELLWYSFLVCFRRLAKWWSSNWKIGVIQFNQCFIGGLHCSKCCLVVALWLSCWMQDCKSSSFPYLRYQQFFVLLWCYTGHNIWVLLAHDLIFMFYLQDLIREVDPDIIIGYNICNFDLPYLIQVYFFFIYLIFRVTLTNRWMFGGVHTKTYEELDIQVAVGRTYTHKSDQCAFDVIGGTISALGIPFIPQLPVFV